MSSDLEQERRLASLSNYNENILRRLEKDIFRNIYTAEKLEQLYLRYVRYIRKHVNDYILSAPVQLRNNYYKDVMTQIEKLSNTIKSMFPTQVSSDPIFNENLITPLNDLVDYYNQVRILLFRPNSELRVAASTAEIPVAAAEIVPDVSATRFAANTNVKEEGGFVARLRSNISNLIERGFSNTGNNPVTLPVAKRVTAAPPVALEPTPPVAVAIPTSRPQFGRRTIIGGGSAIIGGGGIPRISEDEESKVDVSNLTGGGSRSNQ
jgi:hypothetical protein